MSNSVTIPQRILAMANWYDQGITSKARNEGYEISRAPATTNSQKWIQKQVEDILEADRFAPESNPSSSSEEPPQKRRAVDTTDKIPEVLDIHWKALRCCNRGENQAFFLRVKARALRALAMRNRLENLPSGPNENLISFLKTQDLCSLSECSTQLNYRIQTMSRIWQKLGTAFELPVEYWPNGDFSKTRSVHNFRLIVAANGELRKWTAESSRFLPFILPRTRRTPMELRSEIVDPQEHFTRHTLPVMTSLLTQEGYISGWQTVYTTEVGYAERYVPAFQTDWFDMRKTARGVIPFGPNNDQFGILLHNRSSPTDPCRFINLFWTCGYPIHRRVLGRVIREFGTLKWKGALSPELSSAWLRTLEWMAMGIPRWDAPKQDKDEEWYLSGATNDPLAALDEVVHGRVMPWRVSQAERRGISSQEANRLDLCVLKLLQKGETSHHDLRLYLEKSRTPFTFLGAIVAAMKDKSELPRLIYIFLERSFGNPDTYFESERGKDPCHFTAENIVAAAQIFKGPHGWEHDSAHYRGIREYFGPHWIYCAAKSRSRQLMDLLFDIGIPYSKPHWPDINSLTRALENREPVEVLELLHEYGVKPSARALQLVDGYVAAYEHIPDIRTKLNFLNGV